AAKGGRHGEGDRGRIVGGRGVLAQEGIDGGGDALRGGEIRVAQGKAQRTQVGKLEIEFAFDNGAVRDAAIGGDAARDGGRLALGGEAAGGERALSDGIDFAVGAHEGRDEEDAALKVRGIAERGDRYVDARALGGESREICRDHDG